MLRSVVPGPIVLAGLTVLVAVGSAAGTERPTRPVKIGVLTTAMAPWHTETEGFREGLRDLGYVEGGTLSFDARAAEGDPGRLPGLAAGLVAGRPALLFCVGAPSARACQQATATVPIVVVGVGDPVRAGLARTLASPGGNVTGIANLRAELAGKRLELFKALAPGLRRVLITYDARDPEEQVAVATARESARRLGVSLIEHAITAPLEIEPALAGLREGNQDGILIVQSGLNHNIPGRSLEVATTRSLPTMYPHSFWARYGALASYGADQRAQGRQAARLAHRVLTGTAPGTLPMELPDRVEFVVNLRTARRLNLELPPPVMVNVNRVIE